MLDISALSIVHTTVSLLPVLLAQDTAPSTIPESYPQPQADPATVSGGVVGYLIGAFLTWKIFQKCGVENAWFAWIPILGTYITFVAGDEEKPILWTILACIPCINIIAIIWLIKAWARICQKLGKSPWLLLLWLFPCFGTLIFYGYLAFA